MSDQNGANLHREFLDRIDGAGAVDLKEGESLEQIKEQILDNEIERGKDELKQELLDKLNSAANAEGRVKIFATIVDTFGLDAIVSLVPELGDGASSVVAGLYMLYEANNAGLEPEDYLKIIALQGADFFAGAIPIAGDVADYFFKANKWSEDMFKERVDKLVQDARAQGISEEDIQKIVGPARELPKLVDKVVKVTGKKRPADDDIDA